MNSFGNSNIYEFDAARILTTYAPFVSGTGNDTLLVIGKDGVPDDVRRALASSAERLGYGRASCTWVAAQSSDGTQLSPTDLRTIIEGMNPLSIIAIDASSTQLLDEAFKSSPGAHRSTSAPLQLDAHARLMGRDVAAFSDFAKALTDNEYKRKAWSVLLKLELA